MTVIGITGPSGAGKTTALRELEKLGGAVIDCDAVYHRLLEEDSALQNELEERFGPLRDEAGRFDRKRLGGVVFHSPAALAELNAITHPHVTRVVRELLREAEGQGKPAAAIDAIGLFESGLDRLCDTTLAVTAPPETRIRRIMAREGISEEYARARVSAQNPDEFYTARCGYTLINDCAGPREFAGRARALFLRILPQSP